MIVCSCNVLSDHEIRSAAAVSAIRTVGDVYRTLGCNGQCRRCARSIKAVLDEVQQDCQDYDCICRERDTGAAEGHGPGVAPRLIAAE